MLDSSLRALVDRSVPRYTSYPTAPHFTADVDADAYARWLAALAGAEAPVSLYLHVPFCRAICFYCGCATKASRRDEPLVAYAARLRRELAMIAERAGRLAVSHIHWGGGTPSLLPRETFAEIVATIRELFDVLPDAEQAIEIDPRHLAPETALALAEAGITRASLGAQDFDPEVQERIGRFQPFETVKGAIDDLRRAGIGRLNMDLIHGLPGQTVGSILTTATAAAGLNPDRIALFGYAHVPWFRPNQKMIDEAALPDAAARIALADAARDTLLALGYQPVGIDHFARPEDPLARATATRTLRRNFQGYTTDRAEVLIGVGSSSIGRLPEGYVQNDVDIATWAAAIDAGRFAVAKGRAVTAVDRLRGDVISRLLCFFEVDLAETAARHGFDVAVFADDLEKLAAPRRAGYVAIADGRVVILSEGPRLARVVASAFDAYLAAGARHSLAV